MNPTHEELRTWCHGEMRAASDTAIHRRAVAILKLLDVATMPPWLASWQADLRAVVAAKNDALSGEADAVRRAESAELGCEIAYRREPTQAEGDAHADGADECFVTMGGWTGRRCRACGRWVWGGPTACDRCVSREEREDTGHA